MRVMCRDLWFAIIIARILGAFGMLLFLFMIFGIFVVLRVSRAPMRGLVMVLFTMVRPTV